MTSEPIRVSLLPYTSIVLLTLHKVSIFFSFIKLPSNFNCKISDVRCSHAAWHLWCQTRWGRGERAAKQTVWMSSSKSWRTQRCPERRSWVSTEMLLVSCAVRVERRSYPSSASQTCHVISYWVRLCSLSHLHFINNPSYPSLRPDYHGGAQYTGSLCDGGQQDGPGWDSHASSVHPSRCQTQDPRQRGHPSREYLSPPFYFSL